MKPIATIVATVVMAALWSGLAAGEAAAAPSRVAWSGCHAELGPFQCGTVRVPLDYDQPNGATISIALVRLPATDPRHRIGSLFVNPGGPGGSGVSFTGPAATPAVAAPVADVARTNMSAGAENRWPPLGRIDGR